MIDVVPLRYGTAFKKAFSDPEVFSGFVRDVLGLELEFTHIEQERAFLAPIGNVDIRFDLYGEDVNNRVIVEVQHVREEDAFARFHYYHLVSQVEQVTSSRHYNIDRTVYTIVVLTRLPKERHLRFDVASQSSDLVTLDGRQLGPFKHRIVFINPRAITDSTPEPLRKWLELIEDSLDQRIDEAAYPNPLFRKVISSIERTHLTPREMYWFKEESIWEDTKEIEFRRGQEEGHDKGLKEGLDKGLKEGHDKGLKEGRKEGRDEGLKEGLDKGLQEGLKKAIFDACDLLDISLDAAQQAHIETLDAEALETLRAQIKKTKRWPVA